MLWRGMDDERGEKLSQHIAILLEQQAEEHFHVMTHDVHLQPIDDARVLHRFIVDVQADDRVKRQRMGAAQIKVRVRRRKLVKVCAAI